MIAARMPGGGCGRVRRRRESPMDEALAWIPLIPLDRNVPRRIVGARALINP